MKEITIDNKIMGYITLFEKVSHVEVKESSENEDMILFIVGEHKLQDLFRRNENALQLYFPQLLLEDRSLRVSRPSAGASW